MNSDLSEHSSQYCKNNCGAQIEESKMSTHLHECPNKPKNPVLDIIMSNDLNEVYIPDPAWPKSMPQTRQVLDIIKKIGHEAPFDLPQEEEWINVEARVKKPKEREFRRGSGRK